MKLKITILIIALILVLINVFYIDFSDTSWGTNRGSCLGIISMVLVGFNMYLEFRKDKRKATKK